MWASSTTTDLTTARVFTAEFSNYKYFKVTEIKNLQNSAVCYVKLWSNDQSKWVDAVANTQYETYSSTDGYKFSAITAWVTSTSKGTEARCQTVVQFYNV